MSGDDRICANCISDFVVKDEIASSEDTDSCSFCEAVGPVIGVKELAERVDDVYRAFCRPVSGHPLDPAGDSPAYLIADMLGADEDIGEAVADYLHGKYHYDVIKDGADDYYDTGGDYTFCEPSSFMHAQIWQEFCREIKHERRFFSELALEYLREIFQDLHQYESYSGAPAVRMLSPADADTVLYRARIVLNDSQIKTFALNPALELGPPPAPEATPGRMNPAGIYVFYGSFEAETAIAEIRTPVGGAAISGGFRLVRPVKLLDLTVLEGGVGLKHKKLSKFDNSYESIMSRVAFLEGFHEEIRKPVLPHEERLQYLPTQVVSEYLAHVYSQHIDGIIFRSSQTKEPMRNITLFHHAATVREPPATPDDGVKQWAVRHYYDGTISLSHQTTNKDEHVSLSVPEPTLEYVPDSVRFHRVTSVSHEIHSSSIDTHTIDEQKPDFGETIDFKNLL